MHAYLPKPFQREADSLGITDDDCRKAIQKAEKGLIDADLGAGLIKQRIPRGNQGAARGARAVVFYKRGTLAIFLHMFPKSGKANLTKAELAEYLDIAKELDKLTDDRLLALRHKPGWREIEI